MHKIYLMYKHKSTINKIKIIIQFIIVHLYSSNNASKMIIQNLNLILKIIIKIHFFVLLKTIKYKFSINKK